MNSRKQVLIQQLTSALLFVVVLCLLGWMSNRYKIEADWTAGGRNTLTDASQKQLGSMADPVKFLVFLYPRSELRQPSRLTSVVTSGSRPTSRSNSLIRPPARSG